jgi:hypothetical protein
LEQYVTTYQLGGSWGSQKAAKAACVAHLAFAALEGVPGYPYDRTEQCGLLRDVFSPFGRVVLPSASLAPDVARLAVAAYEERSLPSGHLDVVRLAVLADALEDAGASGPLLEHLHSPGPHVRGCHAVDAVLGKE